MALQSFDSSQLYSLWDSLPVAHRCTGGPETWLIGLTADRDPTHRMHGGRLMVIAHLVAVALGVGAARLFEPGYLAAALAVMTTSALLNFRLRARRAECRDRVGCPAAAV